MDTRRKVFVERPAVVRVTQGVAHLMDCACERPCARSMSIETLTALAERLDRVIARIANGERDIIEGG